MNPNKISQVMNNPRVKFFDEDGDYIEVDGRVLPSGEQNVPTLLIDINTEVVELNVPQVKVLIKILVGAVKEFELGENK